MNEELGKVCGWPPWRIWRARLLMEFDQSEAAALFGILISPWRPLREVNLKLTPLLMWWLTQPGGCQQHYGFKHISKAWILMREAGVPRSAAQPIGYYYYYYYSNISPRLMSEAGFAAPPIGYYQPQQHRWAAWWERLGSRKHTHTPLQQVIYKHICEMITYGTSPY